MICEVKKRESKYKEMCKDKIDRNKCKSVIIFSTMFAGSSSSKENRVNIKKYSK